MTPKELGIAVALFRDFVEANAHWQHIQKTHDCQNLLHSDQDSWEGLTQSFESMNRKIDQLVFPQAYAHMEKNHECLETVNPK